jgi:hypothetical protein
MPKMIYNEFNDLEASNPRKTVKFFDTLMSIAELGLAVNQNANVIPIKPLYFNI